MSVAGVVAVVVLALVLAGAVAHYRGWSEAVWAVPGAGIVLAVGAITPRDAGDTLVRLGPTVAFLAAILVFGHLCADAQVFHYLGSLAAAGSRGSPRRLLVVCVALAALVTAVLTLDATVVLLTPVVLATTRRLTVPSRPHAYSSAHLANSGSLLLPVSNLTNLLAFSASGLSFGLFTAYMALPWVLTCVANWAALRLWFRGDLRTTGAPVTEHPKAPVYALGVLALTVVGFVVTSAVDVEPAWAALGGCLLLGVPALMRKDRPLPTTLRHLLASANVGFLLFVLALGVVVQAVSDQGLEDLLQKVLPSGTSLLALLGIAAVSAVLANVVNNIPATLALLPVASAAGTGSPVAVLAVLIGVNVGPNLTYVGSLATLLWRRLLPSEDKPSAREFHLLGAVATPVLVVVAVVGLWLSTLVLGTG